MGITVKLRELSWDDHITALEDGDFDIYYGEVKLTADFDLSACCWRRGASIIATSRTPLMKSLSPTICAPPRKTGRNART